jgi:transposase
MYLNLIQIAESFGVSEQVVIEWVRKEGMPTSTTATASSSSRPRS